MSNPTRYNSYTKNYEINPGHSYWTIQQQRNTAQITDALKNDPQYRNDVAEGFFILGDIFIVKPVNLVCSAASSIYSYFSSSDDL